MGGVNCTGAVMMAGAQLGDTLGRSAGDKVGVLVGK